MKVIVQIPCLNEEETLPVTLADIPRQIPGVDEVEVLIIDDGSTDGTVAVAIEHGVEHIVRHSERKGLAQAFRSGLDACLRLGADIIVNTDGDNQYAGADIVKLVQPILEGRADVVIGNRRTEIIPHFSRIKKTLQKLGSWVVRQLSRTDVPDTTSGFRALSREAALRLNVVSEFTYTLETIIQAGHRKLTVRDVPIRTNEKLRESRLFNGIWKYVRRSMLTILRIYTMYRPLRVFMFIGALFLLGAALLGGRFLVFYFRDEGQGHIQSLVLTAILALAGVQFCVFGLVADLIGNNRKLLEEVLYRVRKLEYGNK